MGKGKGSKEKRKGGRKEKSELSHEVKLLIPYVEKVGSQEGPREEGERGEGKP